MIALSALALIAADPAPLLGGPDDVKPEPHSGVVGYVYEEQAYRAEGSSERYRYQRSTADASVINAQTAPHRPLQAGDPIQLEQGFFDGPLTGGVGDDPPRIIVVRQNGHTHYRWR